MSLRNHGWREVLKVLRKYGFEENRQKGSHIQLMRNDGKFVTVPRHDPIKETTIKSILDQAGITKEDFLDSI